MRSDLTYDDLISYLGNNYRCPVCKGQYEYNPRTGRNGQWAHYLCNTKPHLKRYGRSVICSPYNGTMVCSLKCNNAVQLNYKSQPKLCDKIAGNIRLLNSQDNAIMN